MDTCTQVLMAGAALAGGGLVYRMLAAGPGNEPESHDPRDHYVSVGNYWADDELTHVQGLPRGVRVVDVKRLPGDTVEMYMVGLDNGSYVEVTAHDLAHLRKYGTFI